MKDADKIARYRWEFMRRDPKYVADYAEALKIRAQAGVKDVTETLSTPEDKYLATELLWRESSLAGKYFSGSWMMIDPNKTFDDVVKCQIDVTKVRGMEKYFAKQDVLSALLPVAIVTHYIDSKSSPPYNPFYVSHQARQTLRILEKISNGSLTPSKGLELITLAERDFDTVHHGLIVMQIDPTRPVSKEYLTENITKQFKSAYALYKLDMVNMKQNKKLNNVDFGIIIMAGDMRETERKTYKEIAKVLFPRDFKGIDVIDKQDSREKSAQQYCEKYRKLTNGGWRRLGT